MFLYPGDKIQILVVEEAHHLVKYPMEMLDENTVCVIENEAELIRYLELRYGVEEPWELIDLGECASHEKAIAGKYLQAIEARENTWTGKSYIKRSWTKIFRNLITETEFNTGFAKALLLNGDREKDMAVQICKEVAGGS